MFPITVPPLRERGDDVVSSPRSSPGSSPRAPGGGSRRSAAEAAARLRAYAWPGNVRELQNVIERAVITARDGKLNLERALPAAPARAGEAAASAPGACRGVLTARDLARLERENLRRALEATGWQIAGEGGRRAAAGHGALHAGLADEGAPAPPAPLSAVRRRCAGRNLSTRELASSRDLAAAQQRQRHWIRCTPGAATVVAHAAALGPGATAFPPRHQPNQKDRACRPDANATIDSTTDRRYAPLSRELPQDPLGHRQGRHPGTRVRLLRPLPARRALAWSASSSSSSAADARLLSQIQGRTYANIFGLVERFINAKVLELSRDHWLGDQIALEALVGFSEEELKHQELFRRLEQMIGRGHARRATGSCPSRTRWPRLVLGKSTWAVLALTCHIELFTQAHYLESIQPDAGAVAAVQGRLPLPLEGGVAARHPRRAGVDADATAASAPAERDRGGR